MFLQRETSEIHKSSTFFCFFSVTDFNVISLKKKKMYMMHKEPKDL